VSKGENHLTNLPDPKQSPPPKASGSGEERREPAEGGGKKSEPQNDEYRISNRRSESQKTWNDGMVE
jgi:hypothetical protein